MDYGIRVPFGFGWRNDDYLGYMNVHHGDLFQTCDSFVANGRHWVYMDVPLDTFKTLTAQFFASF